MTKKAFDKIAEGLNEAIAIARGDAKPARQHIPPEVDVRAIRKRAGLSQELFAAAYGFTLAQIRDWEQGRSRPLGGARAYLLLIADNPARVMRDLAQASRQARAGPSAERESA